ncbi:MAG: outer membrane protein assembly factor BamE [Gammaproteobacteria bacterium]|nr:outer membrane protein assembly factor BamE [Gammaproteobacteria bacterium]
MKNYTFLWIGMFLLTGCADDPKPVVSTQVQPGHVVVQPPVFDKLKIGMSRREVEGLLGEPVSVTDTATGTTSVWVFGNNSKKVVPKKSNDGETISQIGNIAATAAGIFIPYAGLVTSIGSQVYSMSSAGDSNVGQKDNSKRNDARILTIEFRDDKVYSIQRAHPINVPIPGVNRQATE